MILCFNVTIWINDFVKKNENDLWFMKNELLDTVDELIDNNDNGDNINEYIDDNDIDKSNSFNNNLNVVINKTNSDPYKRFNHVYLSE